MSTANNFAGQASPDFENRWRILDTSFNKLIDFVENGYKVSDATDNTKEGGALGNNQWIKLHMEAYACVFDLCTKIKSGIKGMSSEQVVYERAHAMVEKYLSERVALEAVNLSGEDLILKVYTAWDHYFLVVRWGRIMFHYLDDHYTKDKKVATVRNMMLECFRQAVFEKVKANLRLALLAQIQKERDGLEINRAQMQLLVQLFVEMGMDSAKVYEEDFERYLLEETAQFYRRTASMWMNEEGGIYRYLIRVEKALVEEQSRVNAYLHTSSSATLISCVETELIAKYQVEVLDDPDAGMEALLRVSKTGDLARMYSLMKRIPKCLIQMSEIVREFIKREGKDINLKFCNDQIEKSQYIDHCLDLFVKYADMFKAYFEDNYAFHKSRKEAFEVFINEPLTSVGAEKKTVNVASLLSQFCDNLMKNEKMDPDELDTTLDKIIDLFSFVRDKDLFQEYYRNHLSNRLLLSKADGDNETQLISKLKLKMGNPFTSKLEGMIKDKGVGADTQKTFLEYCRQKEINLTTEFTAQVLTAGFWPNFKSDPMNPPQTLSSNMEIFKKFYQEKTQGRKLTWIHSMGQATMNAKFPKGTKEILLNSYMACVMLLFNGKAVLEVSEMLKETGLPLLEIQRTVSSLAFGKFPVLKRKEDSRTKKIGENDEFVVNDTFTTPSRKFKIPAATKMEGDPVAKTDDNRKHVIEACVVRIMKSRKQLSHIDLQTECIRQLSTYFQPDVKVIKQRIEDLIQRQYLERDETERNMYRYLA